MRTRTLGPLEVSVVGLGCNNFGGRIGEEETFAVIDASIDAGVTFFDTSDTYGGQGGSEELIGRALEGRRDRVVLATKWGKPMADGAERRGSRAYILGALEASLRRLQTDVIDLYQHHEEDPATPLEETVATLEQLVAEGTVRALGHVELPARDARARSRARVRRLCLGASEYSLLRRDAEAELLPACERLGLGFIPYFPLASGLLTGKVARDAPPAAGTRLHGREISDEDLERVDQLRAWAEAHGRSLLDVAVGGLLAAKPVVSVIAGATKPEQVRANAAAGDWEPTAAELAELR